jgi:beta-lactam-binding protein with PASTA domain
MATANVIPNSLSVLANSPGLCTVQNVTKKKLLIARRALARAHCRIGGISRAYSKLVKSGRVISQEPKFGAVLPNGSKVNLVASRGPRP